jgi:hypothetical protein
MELDQARLLGRSPVQYAEVYFRDVEVYFRGSLTLFHI